jgi:putative NADPH-quinone reductase
MRRNILNFAGIRPVHTTLVGGAGELTPEQVSAWCSRLRQLGASSS